MTLKLELAAQDAAVKREHHREHGREIDQVVASRFMSYVKDRTHERPQRCLGKEKKTPRSH